MDNVIHTVDNRSRSACFKFSSIFAARKALSSLCFIFRSTCFLIICSAGLDKKYEGCSEIEDQTSHADVVV